MLPNNSSVWNLEILTHPRHKALSNAEAHLRFYTLELRGGTTVAPRSILGRGAGFSRFPWLAGSEGESHWQLPDSAQLNSIFHTIKSQANHL